MNEDRPRVSSLPRTQVDRCHILTSIGFFESVCLPIGFCESGFANRFVCESFCFASRVFASLVFCESGFASRWFASRFFGDFFFVCESVFYQLRGRLN